MPRQPTESSEEKILKTIIQGVCDDPFAVLGMQPLAKNKYRFLAFLPQASAVVVIHAESQQEVCRLTRIHGEGLFSGVIIAKDGPFPYRFRLSSRQNEWVVADTYSFPPFLDPEEMQRIIQGEHLELYRCLGAHCRQINGVDGVAFAVWAPMAQRVRVVGDFNEWDGRRAPMRKRAPFGFWELFIPSLTHGATYKFEIITADGTCLLKADPFAQFTAKSPDTASRVHHSESFVWNDADWMAKRRDTHTMDAPMSIYEVHPGSWKRVPEEHNRYLTYLELADDLIPYVKQMGFTHIELMPMAEYPYDGSWGYQPTGLFAVTSRFGTPDQFRTFVERCHQNHIGVIVDWVPGHFPADAHGLAQFDGTSLFEDKDPLKGWHPDWQTWVYDYGKPEIRSFLVANALFWIEAFHIDGLRVDAVASMLHLDYSREKGAWRPNQYGGNENLEAIDFIRLLNEKVSELGHGAVTIAEESTAWPKVTHPYYQGGLGFRFKWNLGWMHDILIYCATDPFFRNFRHELITFSLVYAFDENFILPLSHDEVVHGKGSLLNKMAGDHEEQFANLRLLYTFMYGHPGKKLLFMGSEFAQRAEWNHDTSLDWHALNDPMHRGVHMLVRDLNHLYLECPALYQQDRTGNGFQWIDCNNREMSVVAFIRYARESAGFIVVVCNFTPVPRYEMRIGVPQGGVYRELINTDAQEYGGKGVGNGGQVTAAAKPWHDRTHSLLLNLPGLGALVLAPQAG